jgi:hypothetical protein
MFVQHQCWCWGLGTCPQMTFWDHPLFKASYLWTALMPAIITECIMGRIWQSKIKFCSILLSIKAVNRKNHPPSSAPALSLNCDLTENGGLSFFSQVCSFCRGVFPLSVFYTLPAASVNFVQIFLQFIKTWNTHNPEVLRAPLSTPMVPNWLLNTTPRAIIWLQPGKTKKAFVFHLWSRKFRLKSGKWSVQVQGHGSCPGVGTSGRGHGTRKGWRKVNMVEDFCIHV